MSLRPGVRRSEVVEYSVIDFVYSKRLRLRGLQRTCRSRNSDHPCVNCVFFRGRRKCLNPIYEYFLRPIGNVDLQSIDECLAHLLGHKPNCTRGEVELPGATAIARTRAAKVAQLMANRAEGPHWPKARRRRPLENFAVPAPSALVPAPSAQNQ